MGRFQKSKEGNDRQMESIIHFFKHTLGLCGCCPKTFMTMLMSGGGLVGVMTIYWTDIKNKFRKK